jgi:isoleucyl-tRNA synthetase
MFLNFPATEEEILGFWRKNKVFEKSLRKRRGKKKFVFYEGPPYANGRPGIHHVEARSFKDVILRYKTMRGFYVPRRAGWDTHGLPTEMEVEKILGIKSKKEIIDKIGIDRFVRKARSNVFLYKKEWERLTERMGYWLDLKNAYITMSNSYIESLWWVVSRIARRGLLYNDYKVVAWCPRCETPLSSHEISLGYKKVTEDSVYVKFRLKSHSEFLKKIGGKIYFLAWTTTPWTLLSNIALALNPRLNYILAKDGKEYFILASARRSVLPRGARILKEIKGSKLLNLFYEPPYSPPKKGGILGKFYQTIPASFVSAKEGTGIVHIAPNFGADDMEVCKKEFKGLVNEFPRTMDERGRVVALNKKWHGLFFKDADPLIIDDLKERKLLFKKEKYEHDYPFCWRCKTPLIYFARNGWWFNVEKIRKKLIAANNSINWHPGYLKEGRFGEWVREARDWAISRERFWGTPIPVWQCLKCRKTKVVGSLADLEKHRFSKPNRYIIIRHGEADSNKTRVISSDFSRDNSKLTPRGRAAVRELAKKLKKEKVDLIFSSDFKRTRETAEILSKTLKVKVVYEKRLRELNHGRYHGRLIEDYLAFFKKPIDRFTVSVPGGETLNDLKRRIFGFLLDIDGKYSGKTIIIVSHGDPLWVLEGAVKNLSNDEMLRLRERRYPETGEAKELVLSNYPYDGDGNLDLHRPYIDEIILKCRNCSSEMRRVKDVMDVWFDSGAMPFAQIHYPFSKKSLDYPADYICEGIDQTRGWFYTLLTVAGLLGRGAPYRSVLALGLVLDEQGRKMSKSRGNIVEPEKLINKYGIDAVRWYFYTTNQPWDNKLFREEDIQLCLRRFLMILINCLFYWQTYSKSLDQQKRRAKSLKLIINRWIMIRLKRLVFEVSALLEDYDIVAAARLIEEFVVDDLSRWYIRRIRPLVKEPNSIVARECINTLGVVLEEISKICAPFVPFTSEFVFRKLKQGRTASVHFENWPSVRRPVGAKDAILMKEMDELRNVASLALEARAAAGIKTRQPLACLKIKSAVFKNNKELLELLKDEINVKEIVFDKSLKSKIKLETRITKELREEGRLREFIRQIQECRKKAGLSPGERISLLIETNEAGEAFVSAHMRSILDAAGVASLKFENLAVGEFLRIKAGGLFFKLKIIK